MQRDQAIQRGGKDSYQAQVESHLLERIRNGAWAVGSKIPSERDLSLELKVSRTTVRNAVLALTTRGYFDRSVGQGTFVKRTPGGATVARTSTGTLGYVVCKERTDRKPIASEAFYFDVFLGIEEETSRSGRHTLFTYLDDYDRQDLDAFPDFLGKVDGVVVEEGRNPLLLEHLSTSGIPAVLLAPTAFREGLDLVTADLGEGARKAVRYLRGLGHRRIAMVHGPLRLETSRVRVQAWRETMTQTGATADESLADGGDNWSADAGHAAMGRILDRVPDLTAVFCANDLLAMGVLSALSRRSLRVPEDVSVVGFDDSELARHAVPPLTTMRIHSRDMARAAARRLLERVENPGLPAVKVEFPIDLVVRDTCKEVKEE